MRRLEADDVELDVPRLFEEGRPAPRRAGRSPRRSSRSGRAGRGRRRSSVTDLDALKRRGAGAELLGRGAMQTDALLVDWAGGWARRSAAARARRWPTRGDAGKRVRAALVLAAYRAVGGALRQSHGVAAAVETVHTYSLVHDDLPCMDDDDLRRGRPTTHRAFDLPTATACRRSCSFPSPRAVLWLPRTRSFALPDLGRMAVELFEAAASGGWSAGSGSTRGEGRRLNLAQLVEVHRGKTGALIRARAVSAALRRRPVPVDRGPHRLRR